MLETNRLACEYQPIVRASDGATWAHEALSRFWLEGRPVSPDRVFRSLHPDRTLFFMLESRTKRFQMQHRPARGPLFVNVDPHVCEADYQLEHWRTVLSQQDEVVVEIIENTGVRDVDAVKTFIQDLVAAGIDVALDDIGGRRSLFSFELLEHCQVIKLDRRWLDRLDREPAFGRLLDGLLAFARARGIASILEGVERPEHLEQARGLGVDYVQGFLYADRFVTVSDTVPILG